MMPIAACSRVVMTLVGIYLARVPAYNAQDFMALQKSSFAPFLKDLTFRWHAGEVMLDLVLITAAITWRTGCGSKARTSITFSVLHGVAARGAWLQARRAVRFGPVSTIVGHIRPARYRRRVARRRDGIAAVGRWPPPISTASSGFSRVVFIIDALLLTVAIVATRASFRSMSLVAATRSKRSRRVLVYGAGAFGQLIVREMRANPHWRMNPVGVHRRRPDEGAPVDHRRAGARRPRSARGDDAAGTRSTR